MGLIDGECVAVDGSIVEPRAAVVERGIGGLYLITLLEFNLGFIVVTGITLFAFLLLKALQGMIKGKPNYSLYPVPFRVLAFVTHKIGLLFPKELKQNWYDRVSRWDGRGESREVSVSNGLFYEIGTERHPKSVMESYITMKFEGVELMAVSAYDRYLREVYGDYMQLPPEEERTPSHARAS